MISCQNTSRPPKAQETGVELANPGLLTEEATMLALIQYTWKEAQPGYIQHINVRLSEKTPENKSSPVKCVHHAEAKTPNFVFCKYQNVFNTGRSESNMDHKLLRNVLDCHVLSVARPVHAKITQFKEGYKQTRII